MTSSLDTIAEKYATLPEDVRFALADVDLGAKIEEIATDQGLLIDTAGMLAEEIGFVMLGITHPDKFVDTITKKLAISKDKANLIANEVNEKIFLGIRASLQKIHSGNEAVIAVTHSDEIPSRESVLAGIEDPKSITQTQPVNALTKSTPTQNQSNPSPLARTVLAPKIAPPPINLPTVPTGILENKLQYVVRSTNPAPKQIVEQKAPSGITQITRDPYREAVE